MILQHHHDDPLKKNPKQLSPLVLAYMGDVVFELMVRQRLVEQKSLPVNRLHLLAVQRVCATAQSLGMERIFSVLTEEELTIYKRGRNANSQIPKNADVLAYRRATGLEALIGYLYLKGDLDRVEELFNLIWGETSAEESLG